MEKEIRYLLKDGKFGNYFYDNILSHDMELKTILDRLNYYHNDIIRKAKILNELQAEIKNLNQKLSKFT